MPQARKTTEWVIPASIPFAELKGSDLEECVYWLLDAMGAKDLEWRIGGKGGGAADGGRDLEAVFYTPTVDGELEAQRWWIECKGRKETVESSEVQAAVNNALAIQGLEYIVIATNTQFSNPTRDWVKTWQTAHPRPKVKLWDRMQLERYLSRHPEVVLRLFSEGLSVEGRLQALVSRFWNRLEYSAPKTLLDIWKARRDLAFEPEDLFALIANESVGGNIIYRPWGAMLTADSVKALLAIGMLNITYLSIRSANAGLDQKALFRAFAYLILVALDCSSAEDIAELLLVSLNRGDENLLPAKFQDTLLSPVLNQLLAEMQDLCGSKCKRMLASDRKTLNDEKDEIEEYWLRLEPEGIDEPSQRKFLQLEKLDEPCIVGFPVDANNGCPPFHVESKAQNTGDLLSIVKRVAAFRRREAATKRKEENERLVQFRKRPIVPLD